MLFKTDYKKALGFKKDQAGIFDRFLRENEGWSTHLEKCRQFITGQMANYKKNKLAILGSGWLLDLPMHELIDYFDEIYLFDIHHPREIVLKFRLLPKIHFITTDLSNGFAEFVFKSSAILQNGNKLPLHLFKNEPIDLTPYDCVISINLLNQLDIIIVDYIDRFNAYSHHEQLEIRKFIQQNHLNILPAGKTILITDVEEIWMNKSIEAEKKSLVHITLPGTKMKQNWIWIFDTHKAYHKKYDIWLKVMAYAF